VDGAGPADRFADYLIDGPPEERDLASALTGGTLSLRHPPGADHLTLHVTYEASRELSSEEVRLLLQYTYEQLLDGVGEGFQQSYAESRTPKLWIAFEGLNESQLRIDVLEPK